MFMNRGKSHTFAHTSGCIVLVSTIYTQTHTHSLLFVQSIVIQSKWVDTMPAMQMPPNGIVYHFWANAAAEQLCMILFSFTHWIGANSGIHHETDVSIPIFFLHVVSCHCAIYSKATEEKKIVACEPKLPSKSYP